MSKGEVFGLLGAKGTGKSTVIACMLGTKKPDRGATRILGMDPQIGRKQIPNPDVVFLDELTTGLDTRARRDVWKCLSELRENGLAILLTAHFMDEVQATFTLWASISGIIALANKKESYIKQTMGLSKDRFMQDGFVMLLNAITANQYDAKKEDY